jgi:hypothetical protein
VCRRYANYGLLQVLLMNPQFVINYSETCYRLPDGWLRADSINAICHYQTVVRALASALDVQGGNLCNLTHIAGNCPFAANKNTFTLNCVAFRLSDL